LPRKIHTVSPTRRPVKRGNALPERARQPEKALEITGKTSTTSVTITINNRENLDDDDSGKDGPGTRGEALTGRNAYAPQVAARIEAMGSVAVSVANRWQMGWPARVSTLLKSDTYLACLETQVEQEKTVLANAAHLRHLSPREILQLYEIRESPPC